MESSTLLRRLVNTSVFDMAIHSPLSSSNGWKISIQGKTVGDSIFLYERLGAFLMSNDVPFKIATINRYALRNKNPEQSFKAMTVYCPNGFDFSVLCEEVYSRTMDYKGWWSVNTPTSYEHYAGGLFIRNDRDESGAYLPAN